MLVCSWSHALHLQISLHLLHLLVLGLDHEGLLIQCQLLLLTSLKVMILSEFATQSTLYWVTILAWHHAIFVCISWRCILLSQRACVKIDTVHHGYGLRG